MSHLLNEIISSILFQLGIWEGIIRPNHTRFEHTRWIKAANEKLNNILQKRWMKNKTASSGLLPLGFEDGKIYNVIPSPKAISCPSTVLTRSYKGENFVLR